MAKAMLFDLDGTLLPMDTDSFVKHYLKELAPRVSHIMDSNEFLHALLAGTKAMIENIDRSKTNEQVFEETFFSIAKVNKDQLWPTLDHFYEHIFPEFSSLCNPTPIARQVVEESLRQGYQVAIATNPVFPKSAIYHRLAWAGVADLPFDMVTVYEDCMFTKPHQEYYSDICQRIGVKPKECIMIGNDNQEDMVAGEIGMKTFLVEGNVIDRGTTAYRIDDHGTLDQLYEKMKNKMGIFA
ncbi:HAD family hydrolase [Anaerobacillus sp. MEB173]|uniref:HAD family hydrolase n=1 Tax=Anaerobacillus sp. MEB173 TaxID=3383345 RepID=UPI003F909085